MHEIELAQVFSKELKIAKYQYLNGQKYSLKKYEKLLSELSLINLQVFDNDEKKKAFWINIYNGFTNFLIIKRELKHSMKEENGLFRNHYLTVGAVEFSLDDIEHGLLRRNARQHLFDNDPKLSFKVDKIDYRIHFALNCGAKSCPAIAFYSLKELENELNLAKAVFVENEFRVDESKKHINCSELFIWYRQDFPDIYLDDPQYVNYSISSTPYDWSL